MSEITVATLNLFNRMGDWEQRAPLVIEQLQELAPDVIAFQEIDLMLDQGNWVLQQIDGRLAEGQRYAIRHACAPGVLASVHGIGTMYRLDCRQHEILDYMSFERTAQRLVFDVNGSQFAFVNTHLHHPPEAAKERVAQIERLLAWLDWQPAQLPTVVAGDFNAYTGEPTVMLMKSRFRSAFEAVHGREPEKTWATPVNQWDKSPHGTLDYIYVSDGLELVDAGLAFDRPAEGNPEVYPSDHLGLFARLRL